MDSADLRSETDSSRGSVRLPALSCASRRSYQNWGDGSMIGLQEGCSTIEEVAVGGRGGEPPPGGERTVRARQHRPAGHRASLWPPPVHVRSAHASLVRSRHISRVAGGYRW